MLPLLVVIFLSVVNLGVLIREHQVLQNAAREGARFSAQPENRVHFTNPDATLDRIRQRVIQYCQEDNVDTGQNFTVTVDQQRLITLGGFTVTASEVTVTTTRQFLIAGQPWLPGGPVTLRGNSVFRNLY